MRVVQDVRQLLGVLQLKDGLEGGADAVGTHLLAIGLGRPKQHGGVHAAGKSHRRSGVLKEKVTQGHESTSMVLALKAKSRQSGLQTVSAAFCAPAVKTGDGENGDSIPKARFRQALTPVSYRKGERVVKGAGSTQSEYRAICVCIEKGAAIV